MMLIFAIEDANVWNNNLKIIIQVQALKPSSF